MPATANRRSVWGARVGLGIFGVLLAGALLVYATVFFGLVAGEEFSPQTFKRRAFTYYEVPLVGLQVTPIFRDDTTGDLEKYLIKKKLVATAKDVRWDLLQARRGEVLRGFGEAQILCNYLDAADEKGKEVWLTWSTKHPQLPQLLWPAVARLARDDLYIFIPDLLVLAQTTADVARFQQQLDETLAQKYLELARNQQQLELHEKAVQLYTAALQHAPELVSALEGRAASHALLGQADQAASDLAQANQLEQRF